MAEILDGKEVSRVKKEELKKKIIELKEKCGISYYSGWRRSSFRNLCQK